MTFSRRIRKDTRFLQMSRRDNKAAREKILKRRQLRGNANPALTEQTITPRIEELVVNSSQSYVQLVRQFVDFGKESPELIFIEPGVIDEAVELIGDDVESGLLDSISVLISGLPASDGRKLIAKCEDFLSDGELGEFNRKLLFLEKLALIKKAKIELPYSFSRLVSEFNKPDYEFDRPSYMWIVNEVAGLIKEEETLPEIRGYVQFVTSPRDYQDLAVLFSESNETFQDSFFWKGKVVDFLRSRERRKELPNAKSFIKDLIYLSRNNADGVDRALLRAQEEDQTDAIVHHIFCLCDVAVSLMQRGFQIKHLEVTESVWEPNPKPLIGKGSLHTHIDIIAERGGKTYFIVTESRIDNFSEREKIRYGKLINLAKQSNAVPVLILDTSVPVFDEDGNYISSYVKNYPPRGVKELNILAGYMREHNPELLLWDEKADPLENFRAVKRVNQYLEAPEYLARIADEFVESLSSREVAIDEMVLKGIVVNFMQIRKEENDFAQGVYFLKCLSKLGRVTYDDGSKIKGLDRIFLNACTGDIIFDNSKVSGYCAEAEATLSLIENRFQVIEVSVVRKFWENRKKFLQDKRGIDREFDIVAVKDGIWYLMDSKSSIGGLMSGSERGTLKALVDFAGAANEEDKECRTFVPAVVLKTKEAVLDKDGNVCSYRLKRFTANGQYNDFEDMQRICSTYPDLLLLDEGGSEILPRKSA